MPRKSSDKLDQPVVKPKERKETLMDKWLQLETQLKTKHLNKEVVNALKKIEDPSTTYFEIEQLIKRLQFVTPTLEEGKSDISIHIFYRILEMYSNYLSFIQACNKYDISLNNVEFWKRRNFQSIEDYFLYKDLNIIPIYQCPPANELFWSLTQRAAKVRNPKNKWLELIRPYVFHVELMSELNNIYTNISEKIKKVEPKITKPEIDQIIYLGEKFCNRFLVREELIPTPLPDNDIIVFEGLQLDSKKAKYQQVLNYSRVLDLGIEPVVINQTSKQKLILTL